MPRWASGKNKVFEVYVARICPCRRLEPFQLRCRAEKRVRQNITVGAVSNCHGGQVVKTKCLKSK